MPSPKLRAKAARHPIDLTAEEELRVRFERHPPAVLADLLALDGEQPSKLADFILRMALAEEERARMTGDRYFHTRALGHIKHARSTRGRAG